MKKLLSTGISSLALLLMTSTAAFAAGPNQDSQIPNNPKAAAPAAMVQKANAKQKLADAHMAKLKKKHAVLKTSNTMSPMGSVGPNYTYYSLGVPTIAENPDWNCGPAATLQDANWYSPHNPYYQSSSDNTYNEPSSYDLSKLEGTTYSSGTYATSIPGPLNAASGTGSYYAASNMSSESQLINDVVYDYDYRYPMVADVATSRLDYYNGAFYKHYISVDGYAYYSSNGSYPYAHVVDDNWVSTYRGSHWTSMAGLWNAIHYFGTNPNLIW